MVKIMRLIVILIFVFIATSYAVPNPTLLGSNGLSGLLGGKSNRKKPRDSEQCDSGEGRGDDNSRASAVAISSASSDGGKGGASAKSVAIADSESRNNGDDCDD